MRKTRRAALACTIVASLTAAAMAQTVPVPRPAPQPKVGTPAPAAQPDAAPSPLSLAPVGQTAPKTSMSPGSIVEALTGILPKPGGSIAFDANQRALIERVNTYLTSVQTMVGDFVQVAPDGGRTNGKFYLQKPGRVRFEYSPPSPVELIADGQSMVVRDRKLATQDLYPLSQTPLRFLLADRIDLLKDTDLVGVYSDNMFVTAVIEQRQIIGGTYRLMLMFSTKDLELKQWTVTDPQGYDTTVAVFNLDKTKKPDPDMFKINYERVIQ
ncbi:MAG TPA: outer membrane lipoprotein carrier protein LolA [Xanthobacteraceae bacterium]|jgi:outer membrane lipoprotein-sorting protein|nr:outer membrane lipoprotein carrier protein LolA [Xanthobacteraceae bacterium]